MEKYNVIGPLGQGSFGRVYKAKQVSDGSFVALKVISKRGRSAKELKGFRRECEIQQELHHPNIIRMLDSFETENEIVVITEFAQKELNLILGREGVLSEDRVRVIVWDLVSALFYLHSNRVLHRDLKPQNILMDNNNRAKLCDFGFARLMSTGTQVLTSIKGTPLYMAPELIREQPYDYNADLWSLGCIIYELLMGAPPFSTDSILHLIRRISCEEIQWPTFVSTECISFLKGLLQKNPEERFTWDEILNHSFVKGHVVISKEPTSKPFSTSLSLTSSEMKEQVKSDSIKKAGPRSRNNSRTHTSRNSETKEIEQSSFSTDDKNVKSCEKALGNLTLKHSTRKSLEKQNHSASKEELEKENNEVSRSGKASRCASDKQKTCKSTTNAKFKKKPIIQQKLSFIEDNTPIEIEEWIVFLQKSLQEVVNGDMTSLTQSNLTNIVMSPLKNTNANSKVLSFVVKLLSIPFVIKGTSEETLQQIRKVYLELKLIPNLVYASKLLLREKIDEGPSNNSPCSSQSPLPTVEKFKKLDDLSDEDFQSLQYIYLLIAHLVYLDDEFLVQFCDSVIILNMCLFLKLFLLLTKRKIRIVLDVIAILTHVLRKYPEHSDIIEKILLYQSNHPDLKPINFIDLLKSMDPLLRERSCYFLMFMGKYCEENAMEVFWGSSVRRTLEALMHDSIQSVTNAAERTVEELKTKTFYHTE